jgi:hypothetical protein
VDWNEVDFAWLLTRFYVKSWNKLLPHGSDFILPHSQSQPERNNSPIQSSFKKRFDYPDFPLKNKNTMSLENVATITISTPSAVCAQK